MLNSNLLNTVIILLSLDDDGTASSSGVSDNEVPKVCKLVLAYHASTYCPDNVNSCGISADTSCNIVLH